MAFELTTEQEHRLTALKATLVGHGWDVVRSDERRSIWNRNDLGIFLPERGGPDFDELIRTAVARAAGTADENDELQWQLNWAGWDRLRSRITHRVALGLKESVHRQQALVDIVEAVALGKLEHKAYHPGGRRPSGVSSYLDSAQFTPSTRGSFIFRAVMPIGQQRFDAVDGPSFREFTLAIPESIRSALQAATDIHDGASIDRWDDAVETGVSANLVDALARHLDSSVATDSEHANRSTVQISLHLAGQESSDSASSLIEVPASFRPTLEAAHTYLRGTPERIVIRVIGFVTKLERKLQSGPGDVVITGSFQDWDTKHRNLRVPLDEATYNEAIAAHRQGVAVDVRVEAVRERRSFEVKHLVSFSPMEAGTDPVSLPLDDDDQLTIEFPG